MLTESFIGYILLNPTTRFEFLPYERKHAAPTLSGSDQIQRP